MRLLATLGLDIAKTGRTAKSDSAKGIAIRLVQSALDTPGEALFYTVEDTVYSRGANAGETKSAEQVATEVRSMMSAVAKDLAKGRSFDSAYLSETHQIAYAVE